MSKLQASLEGFPQEDGSHTEPSRMNPALVICLELSKGVH